MNVTVVPMSKSDLARTSTTPLVRALRYRYTAGSCMDFNLHLLCEVGEPYQPAARAQVAEILAENPGWEVQTVELDRKPWLVDALVKKPTTGSSKL